MNGESSNDVVNNVSVFNSANARSNRLTPLVASNQSSDQVSLYRRFHDKNDFAINDEISFKESHYISFSDIPNRVAEISKSFNLIDP